MLKENEGLLLGQNSMYILVHGILSRNPNMLNFGRFRVIQKYSKIMIGTVVWNFIDRPVRLGFVLLMDRMEWFENSCLILKRKLLAQSLSILDSSTWKNVNQGTVH